MRSIMTSLFLGAAGMAVVGVAPAYAFDDDDDDVVLRGGYGWMAPGPAPVGPLYRPYDRVWVQPAPAPAGTVHRFQDPAYVPEAPMHRADGTLIWRGRVYLPQEEPEFVPERRGNRNGDRVLHDDTGRDDRAYRTDDRRRATREEFDDVSEDRARDSAAEVIQDRGDRAERRRDRRADRADARESERDRGAEVIEDRDDRGERIRDRRADRADARESERDRARPADVERDIDVERDTHSEPDVVRPRPRDDARDRDERVPPPLPAPQE